MNHRGFSLLELLIALLIIIILSVIALPSYSTLIATIERQSVSHKIRQTLTFARKTAINRQQNISWCGVNNQQECMKRDYRNILIFEDKNKNKRLDINEDVFLKHHIRYRGQIHTRASLGKKSLVFKNNGAASQASSILICHQQNEYFNARITTSLSGRTYIGRRHPKTGLPTMPNNERIPCN